jgi:hypothetical protein
MATRHCTELLSILDRTAVGRGVDKADQDVLLVPHPAERGGTNKEYIMTKSDMAKAHDVILHENEQLRQVVEHCDRQTRYLLRKLNRAYKVNVVKYTFPDKSYIEL